jgi:hypothetical protein
MMIIITMMAAIKQMMKMVVGDILDSLDDY